MAAQLGEDEFDTQTDDVRGQDHREDGQKAIEE